MPRAKLHDVASSHHRPGWHEWLAVHEQVIDALQELGIAVQIVPPGTVPKAEPDVIFFSKHTRYDLPNVWNIKKSYLPNYVYFDRTGYSGWAEVANNPAILATALARDGAAADAFHMHLLADTAGKNASKIDQGDIAFDAPAQPFVFLPMQLSYDAVMQLGRIGFLEFYLAVRNWAALRGYALVVKPHPFAARHPATGRECLETRRVIQDAQDHSGVRLTSASIHRVLPACAAVFCINSGVGFEALIHLKAVYTAGHCDYHWATHPLTTVADLDRLFDPSQPRLCPADTKRFLHFFLTEVLVDTREPGRVRSMVSKAVSDYWALRGQNAVPTKTGTTT